jgi:hypothetical protein
MECSVRDRDFLGQLSDYQLFNDGYVSVSYLKLKKNGKEALVVYLKISGIRQTLLRKTTET